MFLYLLENQVGVLSEDLEHIRTIDSLRVTIKTNILAELYCVEPTLLIFCNSY